MTLEDEEFNRIEREAAMRKEAVSATMKDHIEEMRKGMSDYERGFIDGMQKQMQSSVDRAVNRMSQRQEKPAQQDEPVVWGVDRAPIQQALDRKAENARELGLDYEPVQCPACGEINPADIHTCSPQVRQPAQQEPVPAAMKTVIQAMQQDPDYAWSWHCNIAMAFVDAGGDHYTGNQGAARFMKMLANVEPAHELPSPQPAQQEPVAIADGTFNHNCPVGTPLYTSPPAQRTSVGLDWLPEHKCGLHLTHNDHRDVYETVQEFYDVDDFVSPEEWHKAVAEDSVWVLHWYPNTPIGFDRIAASTLEAIEAKLRERNT